jgi:hypothetical protein
MNRLVRRLPSPAMLVACTALAIALGGTSYAAFRLPRNSVGTPQLRAGAVTKQKIAKRTLTALKGNRGPAGPAGATGPEGLAGATGAQGAQGPLGPTSGTSAGLPETISSSGFTPFGSSGTVTLPGSGRVIVEVSGFYLILCNASGSCSSTVSAFVDGTAVPGAHVNLNAATSSETAENIAVSGVSVPLPAGTHTVQLETKPSANVAVTNSENLHVTAVALGNGCAGRLDASRDGGVGRGPLLRRSSGRYPTYWNCRAHWKVSASLNALPSASEFAH